MKPRMSVFYCLEERFSLTFLLGSVSLSSSQLFYSKMGGIASLNRQILFRSFVISRPMARKENIGHSFHLDIAPVGFI